MLKILLPKAVKLNITIEDVRLKTILTTNKTIRFTKKSFFHPILGFTQSHSGESGDIERFVHFLSGTYKSDKPLNIMGIEKVHLKCDCINGSIVNGIKEPNLFSFALSSDPEHKSFKEPRIKLLKKVRNLFCHI